MQHRNTPLNDINLSPAQILFGRPMRDFLPVKPSMYSPADVWVDNAEKRELALKKRLYRGLERWSEHTKSQGMLQPGQNVYIQNQRGVGKASKRWDRSGVILENKGFDKYSVRVDRSGRVTDRNRRFLRAFKPAEVPRIPGYGENVCVNIPQATEHPSVPTEGESEPVRIDAEPREVAAPFPQHCTPPPQIPPSPTLQTVARPQRIRKPSSLLNPDTWDLKNVIASPGNFVSQSKEADLQDHRGRRGRRGGNRHS